MNRKIIPGVVGVQDVCSVSKGDTAHAAAKLMAKKNVSAVVVTDDKEKLTGILTERDLTRHVVAKGLDAMTTLVGDIMTANPDTLSPDDSAGDALELMHSRNYRHLPIAVDGKCVGMISIRDLYRSVKEALEEDIRETEAFVFGDRYGA
ncbi:MAG: CBS domain-containing protein [Rhodospirillales bacterium]|nr:CBS domain-containing protein [Rhodospirillales bacterium]